MSWIYFTIFAALMQSVRTAGQKQLSTSLSAISTTWARYGFGVPFALFYLWLIFRFDPISVPQFSNLFLLFCSLSAMAQLLATLLLVQLLSLRNFAVGTTYIKTEALIAAVMGVIFFGASISAQAWVAIGVGLSGIILVSMKNSNLDVFKLMSHKEALLGLAAGVLFALASLWIRAASIELDSQPIHGAAIILVISMTIQLLFCSLLVHWQDSDNWSKLLTNYRAVIFIGLTGILGSIGWFTAFAYQDAAIVKMLGQIEFVFTLIITFWFFKEKIRRLEWLGMLFVVSSVFILLSVSAGI